MRAVSIEKVIGDATVRMSKIGKSGSAFDRLKAFLEWLGEQPGPDQGLPGSQPHPDNELPPNQVPPGQPTTPTYPIGPDQGMPPTGGGGHPDQGLPPGTPNPYPPRPDQGLPGQPVHPWLGSHADDIARAILKDTACDPDKPQPKPSR